MKDEKENIPPFMQDYLDKIDYEGYPDFVKLSREYQKEHEDYPGKFKEQSINLESYNRLAGKNKTLNYEAGLNDIETKFQKKAYETAKQHGFKGPDPNQPSDKDFTKQGQKFKDMIDHAKQRGQEQQTQNSPKSEVENADKQQTNSEQLDREQQRAAFLEKVKATREQITQKQHDNQREI